MYVGEEEDSVVVVVVGWLIPYRESDEGFELRSNYGWPDKYLIDRF